MNSTVTLGEVRPCFEGAIPAIMATTAADGTPNVAYISQVFHVDERHVALSFQFFNKTRRNILEHPRATVLLLHPVTAQFYRLHLRYLRTETGGPVFESMKAQLAGIASHSGMASVFVLRGSDIYEVLDIERVAGEPLPGSPPRCSLLGALRRGSERLARATTLDEALEATLQTLEHDMDIAHSMVLILDPATLRLYTVASRGYATSGVGSEIALGDGVIGVAAREGTPVRIMHMTSAYLYSQAVRSGLEDRGLAPADMTEIPYPGLPEPHSQLAVPLRSGDRVLGVLFVESPQDLRFGFEDEDLLVTLAGQLAAAIDRLQETPEAGEPPEGVAPEPAVAPPRGPALQVRYYPANHSVFINNAYLIKGVAGAILWKLLQVHRREGRQEFCNRELRLDPGLGLPDVVDNLEARLLLLARRLQEQCPALRIEKTGRGRFRLRVGAAVDLQTVQA
ncbi:GAF domain-containing protein [Hydrogenophaga sp. H7]|uniref:GAF domain-containing protein n=1 Tax=Hydrogenophaga sp. H7 TaxID=1882399 RepID=UPI0009A3D743|nr:GAF domain-containing protein [Hydrogenophaga sp. H7]OPF61629.1 histidine kinase [Hydrogenophaga sp. H7]